MNPNSSDKSSSRIPAKIRLSCKLCQRRKVGCDKGDPCATCRRAGVKCEYSIRQRLPRGRSGGRKKADTELKERIGRLEAIITSLGPVTGARENMPAQAPSETHSRPAEATSDRDMTRYLGSSFWESLSSEVRLLLLYSSNIREHRRCSKLTS